MLLTDMLLTQCQTFMHRRNLFGRECLDRCVQAMALIEPSLLAMILGQLSCQELRDVYGFVMLEFLLGVGGARRSRHDYPSHVHPGG